MTIDAWFMDDDTAGDQRLPHKKEPNEECSTDELAKLGELNKCCVQSSHETRQ